jgi:hypothetical protein
MAQTSANCLSLRRVSICSDIGWSETPEVCRGSFLGLAEDGFPSLPDHREDDNAYEQEGDAAIWAASTDINLIVILPIG